MLKAFKIIIVLSLLTLACLQATLLTERGAAKTRFVEIEWVEKTIKFEEHILELQKIGFEIDPGFKREVSFYTDKNAKDEMNPYFLLFVELGAEIEEEPWGRYQSNQAWMFDFETIVQTGDYVRIMNNLTRIAGVQKLFTDLKDSIDWEKRSVGMSYKFSNRERILKPTFNDDWADTKAVWKMMSDIKSVVKDDREFWVMDNGQAPVLVFITSDMAALLNNLSNNLFVKFHPDF